MGMGFLIIGRVRVLVDRTKTQPVAIPNRLIWYAAYYMVQHGTYNARYMHVMVVCMFV